MSPPPREVRKTVSVVFCDVVHSTALGERLDPEALRRIMAGYFAEMRTALERHGGTVEKFVGDAVMAVFGIPAVHEDDAVRAVRAAVEMRGRLVALNEELERDHGVVLEARIGVNSGEVVTGASPGAETLVTGDVVNVASRLEHAAGAGEIVIGELTRHLTGAAVEAEQLEPIDAKGKAEPVRAWRVVDVSPDAAPFPRRLDAPLVGRAHEFAQLRHAYERAVGDRSCQLFTILGSPGIGKSRLACELLDAVRSEATVLTGRCLAYGDGITFWPVVQVVRAAGGEPMLESTLRSHADGGLVAERVRGLLGAAPASGDETFWACRRLFEALAEPRPLVLCFEDVEWAEPTFLNLVEYVAGWSRGAPILLLCLARPDLVERHPTWLAPRPNAAVLTLEPLSGEEAATLLDVLGADAQLSPAARERIADAAEGNPLFVEQMVAMLHESGDGHEIAVPPSLQVLLASRLDRLDEPERTVLERASVAGKSFRRSAAVELAPDELRPSVGTHLMSLVRKGLVRPDTGTAAHGDDALRFAHALVRDTAYEGLSKELRAELHEQFAAWMRGVAAERAAELEEIEGYHLEQAFRYREQLGLVGPRERALAERAGELLGAAGQRAFARTDMPAAVKLLDRAVALVTNEHPARLELLRELGTACWSIGEVARSEALLQGVAEAAAAAGDRRVEWYALLGLAGQRDTIHAVYSATDLLEVTEQAIQVFEDLGDDLGLARAWRTMSYAARRRSHFGAATEAAERALEHARRTPDRQEHARCADALCSCIVYGPTPAPAGIDRLEAMLEEVGSNRVFEANVAAALSALQAMVGLFDEAAALARRAEAIYRDLGLRFAIVGLKQLAADNALLADDPAAAERELREAADLIPGTGAQLVAPWLGAAVYGQGRYDEADALAKTVEAAAPEDDTGMQIRWRCLRALVETRKGRVDPAVALAMSAVARAEETDALNLHGDAVMTLAEVLRLGGRDEEAVTATRRALGLYERKGNFAAAGRAAALAAARE